MDWFLLVLLVVVVAAGLVMVALGLPGLWVILLGIIGYGALTDFRGVGVATMVTVSILALIGEVIEWWIGFKYTKKYGGSRRGAWGAVLGGLVGAFVGIPVPVIGSVIGSFVGSFAGAAIFEWTVAKDNAIRTGWGAFLGRIWATAAKSSLGMVMGVIAVFAALSG